MLKTIIYIEKFTYSMYVQMYVPFKLKVSIKTDFYVMLGKVKNLESNFISVANVLI